MSRTEKEITVTVSEKEYGRFLKFRKKEETLKAKYIQNRKRKIKSDKKRITKKELLHSKEDRRRIAEERKHEFAESRALELKLNSTNSEKKFKIYLKLLGYNYTFQHPIYTKASFFIADFFLPKERLVIEIDGGYHDELIQKKKDQNRDRILKEEHGFKTIRISNNDVETKGETYFKELLESCIK